MTWTRLPIFVWAVLATAGLMVLAAPMLIAALLMAALDRTVQTVVLHRRPGWQLVPLPEPLLVLRTSRGLRARAARLRHRAGAAAGVHAQAAVGLPARRRGHARRRAPELLRVAAPPLRQRHQRRPAAVLHALDRAHLDSHGLHLPVRVGDAMARSHPPHGADALLPGVGVQLLMGGRLRRVPLGCAERRDDARQLLRDGPLPLHDHGRADLRVLRGDLLLGAEDVRREALRTPRQGALLGDVPGLQLDLRPALRARLHGHAAPRRHLRDEVPGAERLGDRLGLRARALAAAVPRATSSTRSSSSASRRRRTHGTRSRSSGSCRRRCRCTTSSASRSSTATPIPYGRRARAGAGGFAPAGGAA